MLILLTLFFNLLLPAVTATHFDVWNPSSAPNGYWNAITSSWEGKYLAGVIKNGVNEGVYISSNGGIDWTLSTSDKDISWLSIAGSADLTYLTVVCGNTDTILISSNRGNSWTKRTVKQGFWVDVAISSTGQTQMAILFSGGIYISTNYGHTWVETKARHSQWLSCAMNADGQVMYAVDNFPGDEDIGGGIYSSKDRGTTWVMADVPALDWRGVACSHDGQIVVAISHYIGDVYYSTDGGLTWTVVDLPNGDWRGLAANGDGSVMASVVSGGGIYVSTDTGKTWGRSAADNSTWVSVAMDSAGRQIVVSGGDRVVTSYYDNVSPLRTSTKSVKSELSQGAIFGIIISVSFVVGLVIFCWRKGSLYNRGGAGAALIYNRSDF